MIVHSRMNSNRGAICRSKNLFLWIIGINRQIIFLSNGNVALIFKMRGFDRLEMRSVKAVSNNRFELCRQFARFKKKRCQ